MSNDDVLAAQIKSSIITKIKTQEYLPGELLPSERDFATMYSVSRYLIHDIFDELISQLVETFYDLSILEEQQTVPEKEKFNISNMLINLITENAVALEKENILPEINLPDYSIYVYSDKNMVERILQNLLTNAIKYSVGTIKITLMEKENNNIIFTIENPMSDSSEIDCNRLFDRFYTGDKSRHNGSTGLGLAVVKTLVAILGGNIVAKVHANSLIITLEL